MSRDYKSTLNLPKTDFPMKAGLVQREPEMLARWEAEGLYGQIQAVRAGADLFVLHDGPPFANGDVHMGTALNKILKDLVVKSRTMLGFRAPFVPGWDCHGLPIEFKVVKESQGLPPVEIRRRSEAYARKFIEIQRTQFKRLGVFGDWEHPYLTLDPGYEAQIIRAFAVLVERGLIYQSKKPVYWSTGAQTALAEAEIEYAERTDPAIYVRFPVMSGDWAGKAGMVIWTTTPWTLPANVAIAVSPRQEYVVIAARDDRGVERNLVVARARLEVFLAETGLRLVNELHSFRGEEMAGWMAQHPLLDRTARVITADFVTMDAGTGQVHIAPGHGADDYVAGRQNNLPVLSPVDDLGRLTDEAGLPALTGKYVFDANQDIVALLRANGSLLAEHSYVHSYPHCWRSKTPVVFRAVEQFFIRLDDLRAEALAAIDQVTWLPPWGRNRIYGTVEARPDWCISRQRTWGVPLPAFYDEAGKVMLDSALIRKVAALFEREGTNLWFTQDDAWWASILNLPAGTTRRNETLDVWIDSGVSHAAVMKTRPELGGGPADVYLEATDQHRGWFQSSLLTSVAMTGVAPYKTVITHGFVVDKDTRRKVSKSEQGTYQKPMNAEHFVGKYGADIVRLWAASVEFTNEVPFSEESFAGLSEAYRSFRNVLRILMANLHDFEPAAASLAGATTIDRWLLSRTHRLIGTCREAYLAYDFRKVFQALNQFCTVDLSSLYVDITKDRLYCDAANSPRRRATQTVMREVAAVLTKLMAPILVFTTEEAWRFQADEGSVHLELFPEVDAMLTDSAAEAEVAQLLEWRGTLAQAIEAGRQAKVIGNALEAAVVLEVPDAALRASWQARSPELEEFLMLGALELRTGPETKASLERVTTLKCARCWRHRPTVGLSVENPDLCDRCDEVVRELVVPES